MKKEIEVKGKKFLYEVRSHDCGDYGVNTCYDTDFFEYKYTIKYSKKYWLFGPEVQTCVHQKLFTIPFNIECEKYLKKDVRAKIEKQVELLDRKLEIEKGEII